MHKSIYVLIVVVLIAIWTMFSGSSNQPQEQRRAKDLPWQITYDRNSSQVFGISLGQSTLEEAAQALKTEYQLAWFDNYDETFSLEAFFERVALSGLQAKVVLEIDKGNYTKEYFKAHSGKPELLQSKAIKFPLADLVSQLSQQKVLSIAYIPKVSLDEELLKSRFGIPEKVIKITNTREHWLYPEKGLDITVNQEGKEVLQYISPQSFSRLLKKIEDEQMIVRKEKENSSADNPSSNEMTSKKNG